MKEKLKSIRELAEQAMSASKDSRELDAIRVKYLGKKGEVTALMKNMRNLTPEERPAFGQMVNDLRAAIEAGLAENKARLDAIALEARLKREEEERLLREEEERRREVERRQKKENSWFNRFKKKLGDIGKEMISEE